MQFLVRIAFLALAVQIVCARDGLTQQKTRENPFHLRLDQKLQMRLNVGLDEPKIAQILLKLRVATGLDIALDASLENHDTYFGQIQPSERGFYAWQLMEMLAEKDLDNGRWEQIEGGYRLTGTSRTPPPSRYPWSWLAIPPAIALAASGAFIFYRRRIKRTPATSANA